MKRLSSSILFIITVAVIFTCAVTLSDIGLPTVNLSLPASSETLAPVPIPLPDVSIGTGVNTNDLSITGEAFTYPVGTELHFGFTLTNALQATSYTVSLGKQIGNGGAEQAVMSHDVLVSAPNQNIFSATLYTMGYETGDYILHILNGSHEIATGNFTLTP